MKCHILRNKCTSCVLCLVRLKGILVVLIFISVFFSFLYLLDALRLFSLWRWILKCILNYLCKLSLLHFLGHPRAFLPSGLWYLSMLSILSFLIQSAFVTFLSIFLHLFAGPQPCLILSFTFIVSVTEKIVSESSLIHIFRIVGVF